MSYKLSHAWNIAKFNEFNSKIVSAFSININLSIICIMFMLMTHSYNEFKLRIDNILNIW